MRKTYLFVTLLVAIICVSCGESASTAHAEEKADNPQLRVAAAADSMARTRRPNKKPTETLTRKLKSSADAVDFMKNSGHWDKYSKGVIPGIASQCLEYAEKLLKSRFPYFIIVDKASMHVILYDKYGIEQKSYKMACSRYYGTKHKFRDNRTPEGFFSAEGIYDSTDWLYTDDYGHTSPAKGVYGPRFIRLQTPVTRSVGIHGTNAPNSPGRRCSHGCIRILNKNVLELVKYVQKGMPIIVNPSAKDDAVNKKEGYNIPMLSIGKIKESIAETEKAEAEKELNKKDSIHEKPAEIKPAKDSTTSKSTIEEPVEHKPQTDPEPTPETKPEPAPATAE